MANMARESRKRISVAYCDRVIMNPFLDGIITSRFIIANDHVNNITTEVIILLSHNPILIPG